MVSHLLDRLSVETLERGCAAFKPHGYINSIGIGVAGSVHRTAYGCWKNMIDRCHEPMDRRFSRYGGRGVTIDKQWKDFKSFLSFYQSEIEVARKADPWCANFHLDKDLLVPNSKVYSPGTCVLLLPG